MATYETSGTLTTAWQADDGRAQELTTTATIPTSTAIDCTVEQSLAGDGTVDNTETVSVADGTNTADLSNFERSSGGEYRLDFSLSTTDDSTTPTFDSATLDTGVSATAQAGVTTTVARPLSATGRETTVVDAGITDAIASPMTATGISTVVASAGVTTADATPISADGLVSLRSDVTPTVATATPVAASAITTTTATADTTGGLAAPTTGLGEALTTVPGGITEAVASPTTASARTTATALGTPTDAVATPLAPTVDFVLDLPSKRADARGWHVEADHPDGHTLTPRVLDGAAIRPAVNDYPEVEIPVERSDTWRAQAFEDAPMRVWKDGRRQPVDTLIDVETQPDRTILRGRGGSQLQRRVEAEFDNVPVHEAAGELLAEHTDYATSIDDPDTTGSEQVVQQVDETSEWLGVTQDVDLSARPVAVTDGSLTPEQSCFVTDGNDRDRDTNPAFLQGNEFVNGTAIGVGSATASVEWDFTPEYTIPADAVGMHGRLTATDNTRECEFILEVDGTEYQIDWVGGGVPLAATSWRDFAAGSLNGFGYDGPDLEAGTTVTFKLEATGSEGEFTWLDVVALADNRYEYTFDNEVNDMGQLDGPELYPDAVTIRFDAYESVLSVLDGELTVDIDDTTGDQHVGITNDGDDALITAANSDTVAGEFDEPTGEIQAEIRLSRYGDAGEGETPRFGIEGQAVDSYSLTAGLDDTPLLIARSFDGQLIDILADIADDGNFAFEFHRDADGQGIIEWTQIGQRASDQAIDPADYQVQKRTDDRYQRAVVYGSNQSVRRESFTAETGVTIPLENERIQPGSESVYDPDAGDSETETFERETDYELNYREGTIEILSDGDMDAGATYRNDYSHETQGTYTAPHAEDWPDEEIATIVEELPDLTTDRACEQAALRIVSAADSPRYEATVTVPRDADFSVVETLSIPGFPETDALHIRQVETMPEATVLTLGDRETVEDVVADIRSRIQSVSRRV